MMKKLVKKAALVLTVAAMAVAGCTATVSARTVAVHVTDTYEVKYVNFVDDSLLVRDDAFANSDVIGSLQNNQEVVVTGYAEIAYAGNYSDYVRINYNGQEGFVNASFLGDYPEYETAQTSYADNTGYAGNASYTNYNYQPASQVDTVVYPRVDKHLSNGSRATWCSLNTDGYYYNENGERFADNGNGTFSDVSGNTYNVIG